MSLKNALTYKNRNGLPRNIPMDQLEYIGAGSYGSIYAFHPTNIVFKKHNINVYDNRPINEKCTSWKHEYTIQKKAYQLCNQTLIKYYDVSIAKPYFFHYTQDSQTGLQETDPSTATACIFTMDRIPSGKKWDKYLASIPKQTSIPPYIFMGTLESGPNRITLENLKGSKIINMPNEAHSFCLDPGPFGMLVQRAMVESFFVLMKHAIMPRDIEFVADGRKHTQSLIAIIDFNEATMTQQRAEAYGEGYNLVLDGAHVYIDLCGLRSKNTVNPMAPYDVPTPQWKFLCNPMICPRAFLVNMKHYGDVADIILDYAFTHKIKGHIHPAVLRWKPLYVYRVPVDTYDSPDSPNDIELGVFTNAEYRDYRIAQCVLHTPKTSRATTGEVPYMYVGTMDVSNAYSFDRFVEFDIQFQHYIVSALVHRNDLLGRPTVLHPSDSFEDILNEHIGSFDLLQTESEGWEDMGLF